MHLTRKAAQVLLLLTLIAGCRPAPAPRGDASTPHRDSTPPPPFSSIDSASHAEVIRYAASLTYDAVTGVSDRQALAVANKPGGKCPQDCSYGPVARIEPHPGAVSFTKEELTAGRFLGRAINEGNVPYEKLNLGPRDTVYAWVQLRDGQLEGRLVSSDPKRWDKSRTPWAVVQPDGAHPGRYKTAAARWIWTEDDEAMWYSCSDGCCLFKERP